MMCLLVLSQSEQYAITQSESVLRDYNSKIRYNLQIYKQKKKGSMKIYDKTNFLKFSSKLSSRQEIILHQVL